LIRSVFLNYLLELEIGHLLACTAQKIILHILDVVRIFTLEGFHIKELFSSFENIHFILVSPWTTAERSLPWVLAVPIFELGSALVQERVKSSSFLIQQLGELLVADSPSLVAI